MTTTEGAAGGGVAGLPEGAVPLLAEFARLRGAPDIPADVSVVIPVNAQADLEEVRRPLHSIRRYRGRHSVEVVLVVNNFPPERPPAEVAAFESAGIRVVTVPSAWRPGEAICFSARIPGVRVASAEYVVLFDADCHIPYPTALLDWYVDQLSRGADAAYTHVDFYGLRPLWSIRTKVAVHHLVRAGKRVVLRVPTTRGSNYAVRRTTMLRLHEQGLLADDLNVGPTVKAAGGRVGYSGARRLAVQTSGRTFRGGWGRLLRQLRYRLLYNLRMLPVRDNAKRHPYHHERRR